MTEVPAIAERTSADPGDPSDPTDPTDYRPRHKLLAQVGVRPDGEDTVDGPAGGVRLPGGILLPLCRRLRRDLTPEEVRADLPGLALAAELALAHGCPLVIVCSRGAKAADLPPALREELGSLLIAVDLDRVGPGWLPRLGSRTHKINSQRRNDVGSKRNLGLAVAAALGWEQILFLDDDIRPDPDDPGTLDAPGLSRAVAELRSHDSLQAVGWTLENFDDNSVAGHGRRAVGMPQQIFIGGGALLVRCSAGVPFFPDLYNEDWLFLIALTARSRNAGPALARAGRVRQRPYEPFRVARAISEEPGEVVGECLMNLLEDQGPSYLDGMSFRFWRRSLGRRRELLKEIRFRALSEAGRVQGTPAERRLLNVAACMAAAQKANEDLRADDLMSFVRCWRDDHVTFARHLAELAKLDLDPDLDLGAPLPAARVRELALV